MPSIVQPDLTSTTGVVLTIGMICNADRCACVLPLATDNTSLDKITLCKDAVDSAVANLIIGFQHVMSSDNYVSFVQAEGMEDGTIPNRQDFTSTSYPGTRDPTSMPSQVAALMIFYRDPTHALVGSRMKIGKNFLPGLAQDDLNGDHIVAPLIAAIQGLATSLQNGINSVSTGKWYRYLAAKRTAGAHLDPVTGETVRAYVATQKRRLVPR